MLALDLQRTRDDAKEMRREIDRLTDAVLRLTYDFQRLEQRERLEREKFALETEVRLLKSERTQGNCHGKRRQAKTKAERTGGGVTA